MRGGVCLGTFQTLVNPGAAIPPEITVLTGITQAMVVPAPRIETVLPTLLEFVGEAVVVGHNVRFDLELHPGGPGPVGASPPDEPVHRHLRPGPTAGARRGPQLQAGHAGQPPAARPPAQPPGPRRRPGHRRPAAPAARAGGRAGGDRPRRPADAAHHGRPRPGLEADPDQPSAPRPRRVPLPRPGRPGAVRGQGHQPALAGALVLLGRHPPQGGPAPARDPGHRSSLLLDDARSGRGRGAPHPRAPPPLQPSGQGLGPLPLSQAHPERGLPPPVGGAGGQGRRRPVPGAAAVDPGGQTDRRSHRDRRPAAPVHGHPRARRRARGPARRRSWGWPPARVPGR